MKKYLDNGNAPAYPTPYMDLSTNGGELVCDNTGMTKREIIIMEMAKCIPEPIIYNGKDETQKSLNAWAKKCESMADALLKVMY